MLLEASIPGKFYQLARNIFFVTVTGFSRSCFMACSLDIIMVIKRENEINEEYSEHGRNNKCVQNFSQDNENIPC